MPASACGVHVIFCAALALSFSLLVHGQTVSDARDPLNGSSSRTWERLLKLRTTASLLQTTAHPDDEQGAMLARVGRHDGARTALLTLNRGEAGDNALGPELFDGLGLIRTAELELAGRYYGLDEQYFTAVADYGFSKRLDEALEHWDRADVLRDMVRIIRHFRPLVVVSRWQGNERDGHGQHQAAGALTPDAVRLAGDPGAYPELRTEGLRPWVVRKLYVGGVREPETWHVRIDTAGHDPVLGGSFSLVGRLGLGIQRSQSQGRVDAHAEDQPLFYRRQQPGAGSGREDGFFDGLDISLPGVYRLLGAAAPVGHVSRLEAIAGEVDAAVSAFMIADPSASAVPLARGLSAMRQLATDTTDPDVRAVLDIKAGQFEDALASASGLSLAALAEPPVESGTTKGDAFTPPPTLGAVTPGQRVAVRVIAANGGTGELVVTRLAVTHPGGTLMTDVPRAVAALRSAERRSHLFTLAIPAETPPTRPYFARASPEEGRFTLMDSSLAGRAATPPPVTASADLEIAGVPVTRRVPVMRREAHLPFGYELYPLEILPPVSVSLQPRSRILVRGSGDAVSIVATVTSHAMEPIEGSVALGLPVGWMSSPERQSFSLGGGGAAARVAFTLRPPALDARAHTISAAATVAGRLYTSDVAAIRYRDLPVQYLYRDATSTVRGVDVTVLPGLKVGYVMGVGDDVPAAIAQLGAEVQLLSESDLATGDLSRFDTIVTGTRAYAVRSDLRAHNARLLEYANAGGNLVVLYNTPEFMPGTQAPFPASLPQEAEEVCEERAPVEILAPHHPLLSRPNRIGPADFDDWIEQRGSKFFASWDARYTPLLSTHDRGQPPQHGGMLHASYGQGHYTYMAYALHRQLPAGVPGAYRLLANLISNGRSGIH
jgi:LmbE family N-acetylglucosaminyl deacetylase